MKAIVAVIGLLAVFGTAYCRPNEIQPKIDVYQPRIVADIINSIAKFLSIIDPIDIFNDDRNILGHHCILKNVHAEGFSNFNSVESTRLENLGFTYENTVIVPHIWAYIESYEADGPIFYGKGRANITIDNIKVDVTISYQLFGGTSVFITGSVEKGEALVTGLYNNEELSQNVTTAINDLLNVTLNDQEFYDRISKIVLKYINTIIEIITENQ